VHVTIKLANQGHRKKFIQRGGERGRGEIREDEICNRHAMRKADEFINITEMR
jgi:hypothetical protein